MFPKMPTARKAYVVDCQNDSKDSEATAWALQGLINKSSAEVYIINHPWAWEPLKNCGKPSDQLQSLTGTNLGLRNLFQKYQGRVKKMFVYDPDQDWTWCLALMSAAQQNGLPVTESVRNDLTSEFGWKGEVEDFRNKWANQIEAYDWALIYLMPGCSKQVVLVDWYGSPLTDYVVASKGFVFWLDCKTQKAEVQRIFHTGGYGVGTSLMGYGNTGDLVNEIANPFGIGYLVSDLYANGSFWSSFPNKVYKQTSGHAIAAEPGKIYASIMWSDGDNLEIDQNPLYKFWHDPARGSIPVATALSPTLQELNSPLLDWYYSQKTDNDELMAGPAGVQFIFMRDYNDNLFPEWCQLNHDWCRDAGFHTARIWILPYLSPKYTEYMNTCGFAGVMGDTSTIKGGPPGLHTIAAANENHYTAIPQEIEKSVGLAV